MDDGLPKGWRELAAHWAAEKDRIRELHLFGSRAKGNFTDESDVDIAYVLTGTDPGEVLAYSICEAAGWEGELQVLLASPVDLEMADPLTDRIVRPAVREHGQLIYRKPSYLPVDEQSQAPSAKESMR
ncbi:nucleotidyltransferase family protein [Novosphingobium endophyticum]|nr:nucleotidyltransferase domain-containing protein [Novosphingobium endophyticum]